MSPTRTFFVRLAPKLGESLPGYLSRLSIANHYQSAGITSLASGLLAEPTGFSDAIRRLYAGNLSLSQLASMLDLPESTLRALDVQDVGATGDDIGSCFRRSVWRVCPLCLEEDTFHRSIWAYGWSTACSEHRVRLIEQCPSCESPLRLTQDVSIVCAQCGEALTHKLSPAQAGELSIATKISVVHLQRDAESIQKLIDLLGNLNLATRMLSHRYVPGRARVGQQNWDVNEAARLLERCWPFLKSSASRQAMLAERLYQAAHRWPLAGEAAYRARWQRELLACGLPIGQEWLADLQVACATTPTSASESSRRDYPVVIPDVATVLDCSEHNIERLLDAKCLAQFRDYEPEDSQRLISLTSVEKLLSMLKRASTGRAGSGAIRLVDASTYCGFGGSFGLSELLDLIQSGAVSVAAGAGRGLNAFALDRRDLMRQFQSVSALDTDQIRPAQAAEMMNTYPDAIYRLMDARKLKHYGVKSDRATGRYLLRSDVEAFHRDFVLPGEIAKRLGKERCTNVVDLVGALGAKPVSGPQIDSGLVYVYRRADIDQIDFNRIDQLGKIPTRAGRPKKGTEAKKPTAGLLSSKAVCGTLSISAQQLGLLVRSGDIRAHGESYKAGNKRFFTEKSVEAYRDKYERNAELMSREELAEKIGCSVKHLKSTWVMSGICTLIPTVLGRYYIDRKEAEAAIEISKRYGFSGEIGDYCGVPPYQVKNWIRLGLFDVAGCIRSPNGWMLLDREMAKRTVRERGELSKQRHTVEKRYILY